MTDEEILAEAQGYLDKWVPILGLQNWVIILRVDPEVSYASTSWVKHYRKVRLNIAGKRPEDAEALGWDYRGLGLERNILHELLHLSLALTYDVIREDFSEYNSTRSRYYDVQDVVVSELTAAFLRARSP